MIVYYLNHLNEKIDLDSENIILQYQEFFDYSWDAIISNSRIISFTRQSATIPVTVAISADTKDEYLKIINNFYQVIEKDIIARIPGKMYVGENYLKCYLSGDKKTDAFMGIPFQIKNITIVTDYPFWIKETKYAFESTEIVSSNNKRYPGKYSFRYANGLSQTAIINEHFSESNFRMVIYGPVVKPLIIIGSYRYFVDIILEEGEYLEIESSDKTVIKTMYTGIRVNCFHNRDKKNSVFRPIQPGMQEVSWTGKFNFDITLFHERSEPEWQW